MFNLLKASHLFCFCVCILYLSVSSASARERFVDVKMLFPDQSVKRCGHSSESLTLKRDEPVTVIVHGCRSSAGQFKALAQVYEHLGEQTVCFEYDDRQSLDTVSGQLIDALNALSPIAGDERIIVLGHSQGGLIARRAHTQHRQDQKVLTHSHIDIATISAPFNGIDASSHCGIGWLRIASLGLVDAICYLVTGPKYLDIPPQSDFIVQPGALAPQVYSHLVVKTDETETCRTYSSSGQCIEDDYVFSLVEQTKLKIETSPRITSVVVDAGHVEIVGNDTNIPWKLISVLQENRLMKMPEEAEFESFAQAVRKIYQSFI
ncbi:esterase/lipase family protein [Vibrio agarivorans]|uniref:esterase/lipase family protein n=1 Tax=Vibrio agarivorans TaxID=153622 RepID=UPI002232378C|nr:alpha/beta hydrolase [Vibrio agarivorans]